MSVNEKTGYKSLPFWVSSYPRAAILDFMTFRGCPFCCTTKELLFSDNSGNDNTSYNTKWRRAENLIAKMYDIFIQFLHTLLRFSNLFQQIFSLDNISNNLTVICSNSGGFL